MGYDTDFALWAAEQAELLEKHETALDWENLAEEISSLGKSQRNELNSRLRILLAHMLKTDYQPEMCTPSWKATILAQRHDIADLLETSPSLCHELDARIRAQYRRARQLAEAETGIGSLPDECPYTTEQVLAQGA
ncbi:MAG: DUF29 domain-containing protein [Bryobacteraceae bacterium]